MESTRAGGDIIENDPEKIEAVETEEFRPWKRRVREWLGRQWKKPGVRIALGVSLAIVALAEVEYLRLARMADRRLAQGPFSSTTQIFASPETIAVGDPIGIDGFTARLEHNGYTTAPKNANGWFAVQPNAVEIVSGSGPDADHMRVEFGHGKVASIISLPDRAARREYQIASRLVTDLNGSHEKRRLVSFSVIPHSLVLAVTAAEDKHFFQHGGFDYRRAFKAAYVDFKDGHKQQGASTLTMQLARSLWLYPQKSWRRKTEEVLITAHLEHVLSKPQIFEDYANEVYLGERGPYSINGFGEAARVYFGKELWQIDTPEAALLAGIVQRPSYFNPFRYPERAIARRNLVLDLMYRNGDLSAADYRADVAAPLKLTSPEMDESDNSYFLSMMNDELQSTLGESVGRVREVVTTLDPALQRAAEAAVRNGMQNVDRLLHIKNGDTERPQVALIAMDPATGAIKALVGGRNYSASQLNHVLAMRQPGSVFKPFVYAAAIETALDGSPKVFTPASMLQDDEATSFDFNGQSYAPKDFRGDYQGSVTLRTALALSLNVATVSLAQQVGYGRVVAMARMAGLNDGVKATPSVALGAYETTPLEIAAAYSAFANEGTWVKPTTIEVVKSQDGSLLSRHQAERRAAIDPRVAYITLNLMQEVLRSGTGAGVRAMGFNLPAAGKTGTSHDGWFAGFTSQLLCVVWVGFDNNRNLNLEGARSALPIWTEFMKQAAQTSPYSAARDFPIPRGVVTAQVCDATGELAGPDCEKAHNEVFIDGTQPTAPSDASPASNMTAVDQGSDGGQSR